MTLSSRPPMAYDKIRTLYDVHRKTRNSQQRERFLAAEFRGLDIDPVLLKLENPDVEPGFQDTRHCFVFWARPPEHILRLASHLQMLLKQAAPNLWLMPLHRMHMTTLEIAHSRTAEEIADLVASARPVIPALTSLTFSRRARLVKPMISFDLSAVAVSFLPAAGEEPLTSADRTAKDDEYTYHHLRRDALNMASGHVEVASRYVVPSAHITLGRYLTQEDHETPEQRRKWIQAIDDINKWLETEVWGVKDGEFVGEWIVGQERGLDSRCGTLWYGGGRTIMTGEGF
ncbi:hypothetical protein VTJ83DRAFT_7424 [Remersonia thermophila]|uniref:Uncharacterized protein n=1 Tax=Remersonia thermophila TaxID=72144 RepID=A0ABR4D5T7_9PEZI